MRSILADKPRVTRFPIEWDAVDQVPTVGGEPQAGGMEQETGTDLVTKMFQQQALFGHPFHFNAAGSGTVPGAPFVGVEAGGSMEE